MRLPIQRSSSGVALKPLACRASVVQREEPDLKHENLRQQPSGGFDLFAREEHTGIAIQSG